MNNNYFDNPALYLEKVWLDMRTVSAAEAECLAAELKDFFCTKE